MIPLIAIGAVLAVGLIANAVAAKQARTGDDPHLAPPHPPPAPPPVATPPQGPPPQGPPPQGPPDYGGEVQDLGPATRPTPILLPPFVTTPRPAPVPKEGAFIGPLPPDPRRQDRIVRFFVLETEDEPLPPGGQAAIQRRYNMAADWVRQEVGRNLAYHPDITWLQLPYTSAEVRQVVLSASAASGVHGRQRNIKTNFRGQAGVNSPIYGQLRRASRAYAENIYPGGLPPLIFDAISEWAVATGEPLNNPYNPDLIPLQQTWLFLVRGAGGYAGGSPWYPGKREAFGWGICGDSVLSAWLSDAGLEKNIAHELIFIDDAMGRHEWEESWNRYDIDMSLSLRTRFGTPDAQTGSFIHESFHGIFGAMHVVPDDIDKLKAGDPKRAMWAADPVNNIMGGSHLDWDGSTGKNASAKIHAITRDEMEDVDYWI